MNPEELETILNDLNNPELEHSQRSELLQNIRKLNSTAYETSTENTKTIEKLTAEREDLIITNSKLFRESALHRPETEKEKEKEQEFSETVTLDMLEQNANQM